MVDVSIIIANYKTADMCIASVQSIIEKTEGVNYEIIVVDDCSPDGSADILEANLPKAVKLIKSTTNLGFGKINNLGMEQAVGKYIFLLNADTLLKNNAVKILFEFMENNPDAGICGGNLFDINNRPIHSFGKRIITPKDSAFLDAIKTVFKRTLKTTNDFNYSSRIKEVAFITGADMMIRADALRKTGAFDSDFFMYCEDMELNSRINRADYKIYSVPQAEITHIQGASFDHSGVNEKGIRTHIYSEYTAIYKIYGLKYVKKRYAFKRRYNFFILILSLGFYFKKYKVVKRAIKDEYIKWNTRFNKL